MKQLEINQKGFTLVEIIMALAVFGFMLMIILTGYIGIVKSRQAGLVQRNTQQSARLAMDQITKSIQISTLSTSSPDKSSPYRLDRLCLARAGQSIAYQVNPVVVGTTTINKLYEYHYARPNCTDLISTYDLTDNITTVTQFKSNDFSPMGTSLGGTSISLSLASIYGITGINPAGTGCTPGTDNQFCSVTTIQSAAALKGSME